jgi:hypothetical protein
MIVKKDDSSFSQFIFFIFEGGKTLPTKLPFKNTRVYASQIVKNDGHVLNQLSFLTNRQ